MLEVIVGNQSVEKILFFLFVNGKCYGTQVHKQLHTPLTPIQKALMRLEKGGLIQSYYEGKTRFYQFNPSFPLLEELQHVLKKGYTLLSAQDKKNYYVYPENSSYFNKFQTIERFWKKLEEIKHLRVEVQTQNNKIAEVMGKGKGKGNVVKEANNCLIFQEKGQWQGKQGEEINFSNVFRWRIDRSTALLSLEHLRRGKKDPVFLFYLSPTSSATLTSVDSYLCIGDTYFGQMHVNLYDIHLNWRVIGPKKNDKLDYYYSK